MANYSFGIKPIPQVENGHVFTGDNFSQLVAHTKILEGVTGLRFIKCNLTNCDLPPDAVTEGSQPRHASFCANLHPEWIRWGLIPCAENCSHVTEVDEITVDGVSLGKVYHYADQGVS